MFPARTLFDVSLTEETIREDYFSAAYGKDWKKFSDYLEGLGNLIDFNYFYGQDSEDKNVSPYFSKKKAKDFSLVENYVDTVGLPLIERHFNSEYRVRTVMARLLMHHADFVKSLAKVLVKKALGDDEAANKLCDEWRVEFGKREADIELYYDHSLAFKQYMFVLSTKTNISAPMINFD